MPKVKVREYGRASICQKRSGQYRSINVKLTDLMRYSVTLGGINGRKVSHNGRAFYRELIRMALTQQKNRFVGSDDYFLAEQSTKGMISSYLGMITAKTIAEKRYGISSLIYISDNVVQANSQGGKRPDFFGLRNNKSGHPLLIEAKGTVKNGIDSKALDDASEQLKGVQTVTLTTASHAVSFRQFERRIACSTFKNKELVLYDIDPDGEGDATINIMADRAILSYYENALSIVSSDSRDQPVEHIGGIDYAMGNDGDVRVGIETEMYAALLSAQGNTSSSKAEYCGLFDKALRIIADKSDVFEAIGSNTDESISAGLDGIMLMTQ